jgi:ribosome maturation protein Sdo1
LAIDLAGVSKIEKRFLLDDFNRVMLCTRIIAEGGTQLTEDTDNEEIEIINRLIVLFGESH